ncbi:hypothetical protein [Glaesserella sp.]|uniref:hypothetical protein n=1 Tax=Glaesserella sp. TaxID=2094731 RepID=UPI00359F22D1
MKLIKTAFVFSMISVLSACALTPEQKAEREAKRIRAEQALQVKLAKQCDVETAELIHEYYNPPLSRTAEEEKRFNQRYTDKVNNPMFQACYKLALQHHHAQEEIQRMRHYYDDDFRWRFGFGPFCYACW